MISLRKTFFALAATVVVATVVSHAFAKRRRNSRRLPLLIPPRRCAIANHLGRFAMRWPRPAKRAKLRSGVSSRPPTPKRLRISLPSGAPS